MTAEYARHMIPDSLKDSSVFLSIDDTMVKKYGAKFEARSKLFDHAAHNGSNLCVSYAAYRLLPYNSKDFEGYKRKSPQEVRYQLGEQIHRSVIIRSLKQTIETLKNNLPTRKIFQKLIHRYG